MSNLGSGRRPPLLGEVLLQHHLYDLYFSSNTSFNAPPSFIPIQGLLYPSHTNKPGSLSQDLISSKFTFHVRQPICGFWGFGCRHIWEVSFSLSHCVIANVLFQMSERELTLHHKHWNSQGWESFLFHLTLILRSDLQKKNIVSLDSDVTHQVSQITRPWGSDCIIWELNFLFQVPGWQAPLQQKI